MSNHTAHSEGDCHPVCPCLGSKSIHEVSDGGVDKRETQGPEAHLRLLDTAVLACEIQYNPIRKDTGQPSNKVADESSKEDKTRR